MFNSRLLLLSATFLITFFSSCATVINRTPKAIPATEKCAILPFINYSETPLAGERVASILYGVLRSKGYNVEMFFNLRDNDYTSKELQTLEKDVLKRKITCAIEGFVNEWRYKVGIDGEPAVSITYYIKDLNTGKVVNSGTLSATEWGHKSLGILTQELFNKAF